MSDYSLGSNTANNMQNKELSLGLSDLMATNGSSSNNPVKAVSAGAQQGSSGGAVGGAASGAMAGAAFGPYGAVIGGVVGGLTGALGASAKRKQRKREAQAGYQQNLMAIESNKAQMQQAVQTNLANSLAATLRR